MDYSLRPKTPLDFLQIDDTNYDKYIVLIESRIAEAKYLIQETEIKGISSIHNIIAVDNLNLGNYRYIRRYQDIGDYRNTIEQDIEWLNGSYKGIAVRIEAIEAKQVKSDDKTIDSMKMRKFKIMLELYNYIIQAFIHQLTWLNGQYDINNNPHRKFSITIFITLEYYWIKYLERALKEAQNYRDLVYKQYQLPTDAPHLPPPRPDTTQASVASSIAPYIEPANVASSRASLRAQEMLKRSDERSARRSQIPSDGGMATRKKIYRKRNKTKYYKRQIKRYTKKYRIHY